MSSALQNRLVGTIIVVALAVIFLPDLLDGKKTENAATFVSVPDAPDRQPLVQPQSFPSEEVAAAASRPLEVIEEPPVDDNPTPAASESPSTEAASVDDVSDNIDSVQTEPTLAEQTVITPPDQAIDDNAGWVIQLGSFRHQKNVRELLDKLEGAGYRAFSRPVDTSAGRLTKVFVGPDLQRSSLEGALPHLRELTGLSGKITEFKV